MSSFCKPVSVDALGRDNLLGIDVVDALGDSQAITLGRTALIPPPLRGVLWITEEFFTLCEFLFLFSRHVLVTQVEEGGQALEVVASEVFIEHERHEQFIKGALCHVVNALEYRPEWRGKSVLGSV